MNVDILINKYFLELKNLNRDEKIEKRIARSGGLDVNSKKARNKRIAIVVIMAIAFVAFALGILLFRSFLMAGISFAVLLGIIIFGIVDSSSDKSVNEWLKGYETSNKKRIFKLKELLDEYDVNTDKDTIESLISATEKNQTKYDYFKNLKLSIGVASTLIVSFVNFLLNFWSVELSDSVFVSLLMIGCMFIVLYACLYYTFATELDPIIRKRYYFHEVFIEDLMQLLIFEKYYSEQSLEGEESTTDVSSEK